MEIYKPKRQKEETNPTNTLIDLHFHHMEWHLKVYTSGGGVLSNGPGMPLELSSHPEAEFSKEIIIIIPL